MTCNTITANLTTASHVWGDLRTAHYVTADVCLDLELVPDVGLCPIADATGALWLDATGAYVQQDCPTVGVGVFTEQFTRQFT